MTSAICVDLTTNRKTGPCSATHASLNGCPPGCPLRGLGCYTEHGPVSFTTRRLLASEVTRPVDIARAEARAIDGAWKGGRVPGLDLRGHVGGDCRTEPAAKLVGAAMARWKVRGGGQPWTYTHAWRTVRREAWGPGVSILASCDKPADVERARARGYVPSTIVGEFPNGPKVFNVGGSGFIPCRYEIDGTTCVECRLCLDEPGLRARGLGIGFRAHGSKAGTIRRRLTVIAA